MPPEKTANGNISTQEYSDSMNEYLEKGKNLALSMNNRGPIRRQANGMLHPNILDAFNEYGFYIFENVLDKEELNESIGKIQLFIKENRDALGRSLSLRVYRLMRDVIMGVENSIAIKVHRTPQNIRAYCELFIYIFPFYYAPTLIYNLGNASLGYEVGSTIGGTDYLDTTFIVYALNIIISFILISLFNVQAQIENPFDQDGMDDIQLENYELEY